MKKPGKYLGLTLTMGILLAAYLAKRVENTFLMAFIVIGVALLIGIFLEYYKFMRR
ncbi:hypothetical protein MASR1M107_23610 [Ignavibacteriales bacterium]